VKFIYGNYFKKEGLERKLSQVGTGYKTKQNVPLFFFLLPVAAASGPVQCVLCRLLLLI